MKVLELRQQIASEAASEVTREQREYLLRQQLKAIQQELGEKDPEQAAIEMLRQSLEQGQLPDDVRKEAERELGRLQRLSSSSPDYQLTRTYIEFIVELPWHKCTEDNLDLDRARRILDEDHYDLEEVKDRILEHLAVLKLNPNAKAPILCFIGPPGVGKTSLGQSIARALGRKFDHMSLGGLHDEAELRGHRRTYIGAMPGRIIQAVRRSGAGNPLLMLDEVNNWGTTFVATLRQRCWRFLTQRRILPLDNISICRLIYRKSSLSPLPIPPILFPNRFSIAWKLCGCLVIPTMRRWKLRTVT